MQMTHIPVMSQRKTLGLTVLLLIKMRSLNLEIICFVFEMLLRSRFAICQVIPIVYILSLCPCCFSSHHPLFWFLLPVHISRSDCAQLSCIWEYAPLQLQLLRIAGGVGESSFACILVDPNSSSLF